MSYAFHRVTLDSAQPALEFLRLPFAYRARTRDELVLRVGWIPGLRECSMGA